MAGNRRRIKSNTARRRNNKVNIAGEIQRVLLRRQEHKVFSTQLAGVTISPTGTVIPFSEFIVEGSDVNQRSGTTIRTIKQFLKFTVSTTTVSQSARLILFRDLFNTGTLPTVTEVLPATNMLSHFSDIRQQQQRRYHILMDRMFDVSIAGNSIHSEAHEFSFKGNVYYNAATAVVGANGRGSIFLLVIGNSNTALYDYDWQCVYSDS